MEQCHVLCQKHRETRVSQMQMLQEEQVQINDIYLAMDKVTGNVLKSDPMRWMM